MKNRQCLLIILALIPGSVACRKENPPGRGAREVQVAAAPVLAAAEKELGFAPRFAISIHVAGIRDSPLATLIRQRITSTEEQEPCLTTLLETVDSILMLTNSEAIVVRSSGGPADEQNNLIQFVGLDAPAALACLKRIEPGAADARLQGEPTLQYLKNGQSVHAWAATDRVMVLAGGQYAAKITPKKGVLGRGELTPFHGARTVAFFAVGGLTFVRGCGYLDLTDGLKTELEVTFRDESVAGMTEGRVKAFLKQTQGCRKKRELFRSVRYLRDASSFGFGITWSRYELKQVLNLLQ
jgi:hypothetical protein